MKKILLVMVSIVLSLFIIGCDIDRIDNDTFCRCKGYDNWVFAERDGDSSFICLNITGEQVTTSKVYRYINEENTKSCKCCKCGCD